MKKKFSSCSLRAVRTYLLLIATSLSFIKVSAQAPIPMDSLAHCGVSAAFFASLGIDTSSNNNYQNIQGNLPPANTFPSNAIVTCGKFKVYYQDLVVGGGGFADATFGADRRTTLCAVLAYVETLFDFSNMGSGQYIRLYVDQSYSTLNTSTLAPVGTSWLAQAGPFLNENTPGVKNGWVYDYISSGSDPTTADNYHAYMRVNFDATYSGTTPDVIQYLNNYANPLPSCFYDLYSVLLHEMGHALGHLSFVKYNVVNTTGGHGDANLSSIYTTVNIFSGLDYSMYEGAIPGTGMNKLILGTLSNPSLNTSITTPTANRIWMNGLAQPNNNPMFSGADYQGEWANDQLSLYTQYGSHVDDQTYVFANRQRFSPGDITEPVMGPFALKGEQRRAFTKEEIKAFQNLGNGSIGYQFTTTYPDITNKLANRKPYCSKLSGPLYATYISDEFFYEYVQADVTTNNNGGFIDFNLSADATLIDPDNDVLTVMPNTLVNFRGTGLNGNNHGSLSVINGGQTIRFTLKPNFIGRAQFGFNLYDGKEKGGYVIYTVDVNTGTNVTYTAGTDNLVLNGNFEEGIETKRIGTTEELIPNCTWEKNFFYEGKLLGHHLSDCHPFISMNNYNTIACGAVIGDSYAGCGQQQLLKSKFGYPTTAFPGLGNPPSSSGGSNKRYQLLNNPTFTYGIYNMRSQLQNCHKYRIEYDIYSPTLSTNTFLIGFGHHNTITYPVQGTAYNPVLNFSKNLTPTYITGTWNHITQEFWYCGNPSDVMYLINTTGAYLSKVYLDNISIVEILNPPLIAVTIGQTPLTPCTTRLTANVTNQACNVTYQWLLNGMPIPGATAVPMI